MVHGIWMVSALGPGYPNGQRPRSRVSGWSVPSVQGIQMVSALCPGYLTGQCPPSRVSGCSVPSVQGILCSCIGCPFSQFPPAAWSLHLSTHKPNAAALQPLFHGSGPPSPWCLWAPPSTPSVPTFCLTTLPTETLSSCTSPNVLLSLPTHVEQRLSPKGL